MERIGSKNRIGNDEFPTSSGSYKSNVFEPSHELQLPFTTDISAFNRRKQLEKEKSVVVLSPNGPVNELKPTPGDQIVNFQAWLYAIEPIQYEEESEIESSQVQVQTQRNKLSAVRKNESDHEGKPKKTKKWKTTRRNLRAFIVTVIYYIIGVAFFNAYEGWDLLTCVYYITSTAATIGYGEYHPTTDNSRVFAIVYFFFGVIIIVNVVGLAMEDFIDSLVLEFQKAVYESDSDLDVVTPSEELKILVIRNFSLFLFLALCMLFGAFFFKHYEGWSYISSWYFTFVTIMSVGYGDLLIQADESKVFLIFFMLFTISIVSAAIGSFAKVKLMLSTINLKKSLLSLEVDHDYLSYMDMDGDSTLTKFEYVIAMLIKTGAIEGDKHVAPLIEKFDELDASGDGELSIEDILAAQELYGHTKKKKKLLSRKRMTKKMRAFTASFEANERVLTKSRKREIID